MSRSETVAVYSPLAPPSSSSSQVGGEGGSSGVEELGPWVVDGYKFFSSATDADVTILLAKTPGAGGRLSAFFAPTRLASGERNGVRMLRLKKKLGTRALPTAELEIKGMRAWLIGEEGEGIKEVTTVLDITRVHNAVSAVSFMRRGLAIAKVGPHPSRHCHSEINGISRHTQRSASSRGTDPFGPCLSISEL
jgi:alkylation response protein AidB-like acyl-CoA dehydrogenase